MAGAVAYLDNSCWRGIRLSVILRAAFSKTKVQTGNSIGPKRSPCIGFVKDTCARGLFLLKESERIFHQRTQLFGTRIEYLDEGPVSLIGKPGDRRAEEAPHEGQDHGLHEHRKL